MTISDPQSEKGATPTVPANGDLATTRAEDVLRFCERVRFSGTLGFQAPEGRGILPMLCGVPEIAAGDDKLEAALDEFLALDHGTYALSQLLPPLEGATAQGDLKLRGSLQAQTPADLLRYCEGAGLTGSLTLRRDDKTYVARYLRGELQSVTVDDEADADLARVFAWDRGDFEIAAKSVFERERKATLPDEPLLKTLEIALTQILDQSERGAAAIRPNSVPPPKPSILRGATQPFGVQRAPGAPQRPATIPPPKHRSIAPPQALAETTVKVYLVDKGKTRGASEAPDASSSKKSEAVAVDARPEPTASESSAASAPPSEPDSAAIATSEPASNGSNEASAPRETDASPASSADAKASTGARASRLWTATFAVIVVATLASALFVVADLVR